MSSNSPKKDPNLNTTPAATAKITIPKTPWKWWHVAIVSVAPVFIFIISIWLLPTPYYKTGFRTLSELQAHAATLDEWIKMENDNELLPCYENYYQNTFKRTILHRWKEKCVWLLSKLFILQQPPFSSSFFKTILDEVLQDRLKKGWNGDLIQKIEIKSTSKIIIFGPIQGAFHSIVRDLEQLKKLEIIDENLKLKNSDYYMVFLGNVVNRSPYTLDLFSVVLRLLQKNPNNVIYLRGSHEFFDTWKDHTLKRELELRCGQLSTEAIPLRTNVNQFFDTLPITLYTTMPSWSTDQFVNYVKISALTGNKRLFKMLDETTYSKFLISPSQAPLDTFDLKQQPSEPEIESDKLLLRAIVKDILKRESFEPTEGLCLLPPEMGTLAWSVFSSSSEPARHLMQFFYDAFVVIEPEKQLEDWKINLYNRDIRNHSNKKFTISTYLFFTGEKLFS